jgi:hypothetical protein
MQQPLRVEQRRQDCLSGIIWRAARRVLAERRHVRSDQREVSTLDLGYLRAQQLDRAEVALR